MRTIRCSFSPDLSSPGLTVNLGRSYPGGAEPVGPIGDEVLAEVVTGSWANWLLVRLNAADVAAYIFQGRVES